MVASDGVRPGGVEAGWAAVLVVVDGHHEVPIGVVVGRSAGLAEVDALARLQLVARRLGCSIRVRGAGPELRGLLELVGLPQLAGDSEGPGGPEGPGLDAPDRRDS